LLVKYSLGRLEDKTVYKIYAQLNVSGTFALSKYKKADTFDNQKKDNFSKKSSHRFRLCLGKGQLYFADFNEL
jgi:hypothetical protein